MIYKFGELALDETRRVLHRGDFWIETEPKVFDVLLYLIKNRDRAVMRDELLEHCWPRVHVSDGTLSRCMSRVRNAIGQTRSASEPIYTLHGRGYRFVAPVSLDEAAGAGPREESAVPAGDEGRGAGVTEAERRFVSVLDCALSLREDGAAEDAEALHAAMHGFFDSCDAVLARFGGTVSQRTGEGVVVHFGHPASAERAAEAAVLAAEELIAKAKEFGLVARIGIASGRAIVDPSCSGAAGYGMVVGIDPLQPASLRSQVGPQQSVVDDNTRRLTEAGFIARAAGEATVRGKQVARFILTPREHPASADIEDMPFYGRTSELAFLKHCWNYALEGQGQTIHLTGDAGIGKSRLVLQLIDTMGIPCESVLRADCSPYHELTPFYPLLVLLRRLLGIDPDTPALRQLAAVEALLEKLDQPETDHLPLLASLLSISVPQDQLPALRLDPSRQRERTLEALVFLAYSMAERGPVLFWVDDVQWADPSTLAVVARIRARCSAAKILVILAGRGPDKRLQIDPAGATTIALGPFTRAETLGFLDIQSERFALTREQIERIAASSDGVPLYLREIVRMALDAVDGTQKAAIPETLQSLLQSRLDQAGSAKQVAQWIALFGSGVEKEVLERASGIPQDELEAALRRLTALGLLRESGTGRGLRFGFNHNLLREAAYDSLLVGRRRERHREVAEMLVAEFPQIVEREPEEVARHFEASDQPGRAAAYWRAAGRASVSHYATDEARALYGRALDALHQSEQEAEVAEYLREIDSLLAEF